MSGSTYIYGLVDPRDGEIRYVGKAVDPLHRLHGHRSAAYTPRLTAKGRWLRDLFDSGLDVQLVILDRVEGDGHQREREWIARLNADGRLVNALVY